MNTAQPSAYAAVLALWLVMLLAVSVAVIVPGGRSDATSVAPLVTAVAAGGDHTCVLAETGGVFCSGDDQFGQLGNGGAATDSNSMVSVSGLESGVTKLFAGAYDTCALESGQLMCWGDNAQGQLANGSFGIATTPVLYEGLTAGVNEVDIGFGTICVLETNGNVACSGAGYLGQLGNGAESGEDTCGEPPDTFPCTTSAHEIPGLDNVVDIGMGKWGGCAVIDGGEVDCWGANNEGQLGQGDTSGPTTCAYQDFACSTTPIKVQGLPDGVDSVGGGDLFFCTTAVGEVQCWGDNASHQMGLDSSGLCSCEPAPVAVTGAGDEVDAITAGRSHLCVQTDHELECAGLNFSGQLGTGDTTTTGCLCEPDFVAPSPPLVLACEATTQCNPLDYDPNMDSGGNATCIVTIDFAALCAASTATGNWAPERRAPRDASVCRRSRER